MNHLLDIDTLDRSTIEALIQRALEYKQGNGIPTYPDITIATLFYENSTRTRISFELAAKKLGMSVVNVDLQHSSESKGEIIEDTMATLAAMGIDGFVVRHTQQGLPRALAEAFPTHPMINAGDGKHAHPSQALLDMMTIIENKPDLTSLHIAIIGDIRHSRVANSFQWAARHLNVGKLTLIAPPAWQPEQVIYGELTSSLDEGLANADVVMCLRVQRERLEASETLDLRAYQRDYQLTPTNLRLANPTAMVMHPGPMNRGVEIDSAVADGPQSFILQQVNHGVWMRMAILDALFHAKLHRL